MTRKRTLTLSALSAVMLLALPVAAVQTISQQLKLTGGNDVNVNNNTGWLVNESGGLQMGIDANEIQARNNSVGSTLYLQHGGGDLSLAHGGGNVNFEGGDVNFSNDSVRFDNFDGVNFANNTNIFFEGFTQFRGPPDNLLMTMDATLKRVDFYSDTHFQGRALIGAAFSGSGSTLCRASSSQLVVCSSARRFKKDIVELGSGLREIMAMNPVSFTWKESGVRDVGFIAEDSLEVVPELVEYDDQGNVQGFNYRHYTAVLTRAVQEQQQSIEQGQRAIALRDRELAEQHSELAAQASTLQEQARELRAANASISSQAIELQKLREQMSQLSAAVARLSDNARP
jgi:hypothetical protein